MNKKKTYEFDVVTEYITIEESVANLKKAIPNAVCRLHPEPSPGGGWSWLFVTVDENDADKLMAWYCGDEETAAEYETELYEARQSPEFFMKSEWKTF